MNAIEIGQTIVSDNLKIHRSMCSVRVTDMANAGRRGQTCTEVVLYDLDYCCNQSVGARAALEAVLNTVQTLNSTTLVEGLFASFCGYVDGAGLFSAKVDTRTLRGVDVAPADCAPIIIETPHLYIWAELSGFSVRDNLDQNNLPTLIDPVKGAKTASKKFYKWAKKHQGELAKMSFNGVRQAMQANGIASHYYCAMD